MTTEPTAIEYLTRQERKKCDAALNFIVTEAAELRQRERVRASSLVHLEGVLADLKRSLVRIEAWEEVA